MDFWVNIYMYVEIMDTCTDEYDAAWQLNGNAVLHFIDLLYHTFGATVA